MAAKYSGTHYNSCDRTTIAILDGNPEGPRCQRIRFVSGKLPRVSNDVVLSLGPQLFIIGGIHT